MACGIISGIQFPSCENLKTAAGGLKQRVYIGNHDQLASPSFRQDGDGYLYELLFDETYQGLYKFIGVKNGNSTTSDMVTTEGGNANFTHSVTLTLHDLTPNDKETLEDLAYSTVFAVVETSRNRFEVFGLDLGLSVESGPRNSGATPSESTARVVTLSGDQASLEKIFFRTDYDTTVAYLDSLVV